LQAEDGIRDGHVTGVQTCALPILRLPLHVLKRIAAAAAIRLRTWSGSRTGPRASCGVETSPRSTRAISGQTSGARTTANVACGRSEERRVGEGCGAAGGRAVRRDA